MRKSDFRKGFTSYPSPVRAPNFAKLMLDRHGRTRKKLRKKEEKKVEAKVAFQGKKSSSQSESENEPRIFREQNLNSESQVRENLNVVLKKIKVAVAIALQDNGHSYRLALCSKVLANDF